MTPAAMAPGGARNRIYYYDLLRIVSFFLVTLYHMLVQLALCGICPMDRVAPWFQNGNMHIATLAVALFFMLSGAGLTVSAQSGLSPGKYYKSRFLRLMVPFYLAVLLACGFKLVTAGRLPDVFYAGAPAWRLVFTLLGVDGWLSLYGVQTFYVGIGEWFLGELIVLTAVFPLLRWARDRFPKLFFAACTGVYLYMVHRYSTDPNLFVKIAVKGYDFVVGMYFAKYCRRIPGWCAALAAVAAACLMFAGLPFEVNPAIRALLLSASVFAAFSGLEPLLQRRKPSLLQRAQIYSYPLFLVHHRVIYAMTSRFAPYYSGTVSIVMLFAAEFLVTAALAVGVKRLSDRAIGLANGRR